MPEDEVLKWDRQSKLFLSLCTEEEKSPAEDKDDSVMERPFSVSKAVFTVIVHIVFLGDWEQVLRTLLDWKTLAKSFSYFQVCDLLKRW